MGLHAARRQVHLDRDVGVGQTPGRELEHGQLARGDRGQRRVRRRRRDGQQRPTAEVQEAPGHRGREQRLPVGDQAHRADQLLGRAVLHEEAAGPGPQRPDDVLVEVERGHTSTRAAARRQGQDPPGGLDAVHDRHAHVHDDDSGRSRWVSRTVSAPSPASPTTVMSGSASRQVRSAAAHQGLVVGDQYGERHGAPCRPADGPIVAPGAGIVSTAVGLGERQTGRDHEAAPGGPANSSPPSIVARCCMLTRP